MSDDKTKEPPKPPENKDITAGNEIMKIEDKTDQGSNPKK